MLLIIIILMPTLVLLHYKARGGVPLSSEQLVDIKESSPDTSDSTPDDKDLDKGSSENGTDHSQDNEHPSDKQNVDSTESNIYFPVGDVLDPVVYNHYSATFTECGIYVRDFKMDQTEDDVFGASQFSFVLFPVQIKSCINTLASSNENNIYASALFTESREVHMIPRDVHIATYSNKYQVGIPMLSEYTSPPHSMNPVGLSKFLLMNFADEVTTIRDHMLSVFSGILDGNYGEDIRGRKIQPPEDGYIVGCSLWDLALLKYFCDNGSPDLGGGDYRQRQLFVDYFNDLLNSCHWMFQLDFDSYIPLIGGDLGSPYSSLKNYYPYDYMDVGFTEAVETLVSAASVFFKKFCFLRRGSDKQVYSFHTVRQYHLKQVPVTFHLVTSIDDLTNINNVSYSTASSALRYLVSEETSVDISTNRLIFKPNLSIVTPTAESLLNNTLKNLESVGILDLSNHSNRFFVLAVSFLVSNYSSGDDVFLLIGDDDKEDLSLDAIGYAFPPINNSHVYYITRGDILRAIENVLIASGALSGKVLNGDQLLLKEIDPADKSILPIVSNYSIESIGKGEIGYYCIKFLKL